MIGTQLGIVDDMTRKIAESRSTIVDLTKDSMCLRGERTKWLVTTRLLEQTTTREGEGQKLARNGLRDATQKKGNNPENPNCLMLRLFSRK